MKGFSLLEVWVFLIPWVNPSLECNASLLCGYDVDFLCVLMDMSLSFCIPVYHLQNEDTESESENECIKNCVAVKKKIKFNSCGNRDNISTSDKGTVLIVTKGISRRHVSLLYLFLFHTSELGCIAYMLLEFQNFRGLLLLIL